MLASCYFVLMIKTGQVEKVLQIYARRRMGRGRRKENKVHAFISTLLKQIRKEQNVRNTTRKQTPTSPE